MIIVNVLGNVDLSLSFVNIVFSRSSTYPNFIFLDQVTIISSFGGPHPSVVYSIIMFLYLTILVSVGLDICLGFSW